jgi:hypothetical protein
MSDGCRIMTITVHIREQHASCHSAEQPQAPAGSAIARALIPLSVAPKHRRESLASQQDSLLGAAKAGDLLLACLSSVP